MDSTSKARKLLEGNPDLALTLQAAIEAKMSALIGKSSGYIESLPESAQNRIVALKALHRSHTVLEEKFEEELDELEAKYRALYAPLYVKRSELVNGTAKPESTEGYEEEKKKIAEEKEEGQRLLESVGADEKSAGVDTVEEDGEKGGKEKGEKGEGKGEDENPEEDHGVPDFWLIAMQNEPSLRELIEEHDEEILKHIVDIRSVQNRGEKGYTLEFEFSDNPYFTNKVLTKSYVLENDLELRQMIMDKSIGTVIDWKADMDVTQTTKQVKQKRKKGGRGTQTRTIAQVVPQESFFNFFSPPPCPEEGTEMENEEAEAIEEALEEDYEVGQIFQERLIPRAVLWFTGDAAAAEELDQLGAGMFGDSEDDEDEDEDEDDEGEEDGEGDRRMSGKPSLQELLARGGDGDSDDDPEYIPRKKKEEPGECKQQ